MLISKNLKNHRLRAEGNLESPPHSSLTLREMTGPRWETRTKVTGTQDSDSMHSVNAEAFQCVY